MTSILSKSLSIALLVCFNHSGFACQVSPCPMYDNWRDNAVTLQGQSVSCQMTRVVPGHGQKSTTRTIPLEDNAFKSSAGIDVGDMNYSFDIMYESGTIDVFFYENKRIQDEVGSLSFVVDGSREKLREDIQDHYGNTILKMTCWENF